MNAHAWRCRGPAQGRRIALGGGALLPVPAAGRRCDNRRRRLVVPGGFACLVSTGKHAGDSNVLKTWRVQSTHTTWQKNGVRLQYAREETKAKIEEILSPAFEAVVGVIGAIILWCRDKMSGAQHGTLAACYSVDWLFQLAAMVQQSDIEAHSGMLPC